MHSTRFFIGDWQVDSADNTLRQGKRKRSLEPKAMDVLLLLCQHQGEVVSADTIVEQCWPHAETGDNPVHKAITQLRRALDDKANAPRYIETIRKRGYRIISDVTFPLNEQAKVSQVRWEHGSPYPGLVPFNESQADVYFGRASATDSLLAKITLQRKLRHLLTVVLGPSGSGKSSLIRAGVLPKLKSAAGDTLCCMSDAHMDAADIAPDALFSELASALLDWEVNNCPVFEGYSSHTLADALHHEPEAIRSVYEQRFTGLVARKQPAACVLVFDRLEAILATDTLSQRQKEAFFHTIDCLASGNSLLVILLCRNDFYPLLTQYPALMRHKDKGAHFDLLPPTTIELSQIIRLPAKAAGLQWEVHAQTGVGLDEQLCLDAVTHADGLPLLQYTLQELYLQRQDNTLLYSVYNALGGVEGAIGQKAEDVFQAMPEPVQHSFGKVMARLVNLNQQEEQLTSRSVQWSALGSEQEKQFVEHMVEQRLFVSHLHNDAPCFNVAHEALLRRWERVKDWVTQHHAALLHKNRLAQQTRQWLNDNKSQAFVLTEGKPLTDALALQADSVIALTDDEQELIAYSVNQRNRKRWLKRGTATMLAGLTFFSVVAMFSSQQSQQLAERKRLEAEDLMSYMIGDFADKLRSVRRMDLLEGISQQALRYVEAAQKQEDRGFFSPSLPPPSFALRLQHAKSLQAMAEVRYYRDDAEEAKTYYQDAELRLTELLQEAPDNVDALKAAGLNAFWLGQLAYDKKEYQIATEHFSHYLFLSQQLVAVTPDDEAAKLELAYALNSLGSAQLKTMEFEQAIDNFEQSLVLKESLGGPKDGLSALYFVNSYLWITKANLHLGKLDNALNYIAIAEGKIAALSDMTDLKNDINESLMYLLIRKAEIKYFSGDKMTAIELLSRAKKNADRLLTQDPENSIWKRDSISIVTSLGKLNTIFPKTTKSLNFLTKLDASMSSQMQKERILALVNITNAYQNWGEWEKSAVLLERIKKSEGITILQTREETLHIEEILAYSEYLMSEVIQSKHDRKDFSGACQTIQMITQPYLAQSRHPLLHIASVFSTICKYDNANLNNMSDEVKSLIAQHPEYFSLFIKDI